MALCSTSEIPQQAFQYWWQQQGDWVEAPNVRRGGESGVQRLLDQSGVLYAKRQIGHVYRSLLHPRGLPTVLRERRALLALDALGVHVPQLVYCGVEHDPQQGWRGLLVTAELTGFTDIESWYAQGGREACGEAPMRNCCNSLVQPWRACTSDTGNTAACTPSMCSSVWMAIPLRWRCSTWKRAANG